MTPGTLFRSLFLAFWLMLALIVGGVARAANCPVSPTVIPWTQSMAQGGPFSATESDGTPVLVGWRMCDPTVCPVHWKPWAGPNQPQPSMDKLPYVMGNMLSAGWWRNYEQYGLNDGWIEIADQDDITLYVCGTLDWQPIEGLHFINARRVRIEVCPGTVPPSITHDTSSDQIEFMGQCVKPVPEPGASLSTMIGSFVLALIRRLGR